MTDISFYHLQRQGLEAALPKLLERVMAAGLRAVVLAGTEERVQALNAGLWTYDPATFLAHGSAKDGNAEDQPIFLTVAEENPNGATVLVVVDDCAPQFLSSFDRCLEMFNGNDAESVAQARERWRTYKDTGHNLTYWQQSDAGGWEQKA